MLGDTGHVADLTRVVSAMPRRDAINRQDAGKGRIVAYLNVARSCPRGLLRGKVSDLNRLLVHQPRDVERLVPLARRTH